ncbi:MAG: competence protein ComK [Sporosarcina sp.]
MLNCDSDLIDGRALALKSIFTGEYRSKIITTHGTYFSKLTPKNVLNEACLTYFSTQQGRKQAASSLLNYSKKPPFIIAPNEIGVFPTKSPQNPDCVWIFNHRLNVEEVVKGQSVVTFVNGTSINVKASKNMILKQKQRLHTLMSISHLMHREKELYAGVK